MMLYRFAAFVLALTRLSDALFRRLNRPDLFWDGCWKGLEPVSIRRTPSINCES
jgi:hypothetical protein